MSRLPAIDREALAPADQAIWDRVRLGRSPEMRGPYSVSCTTRWPAIPRQSPRH